MYTNAHTHTETHTHRNTHTLACIHARTHTRTHASTHVHKCTHTYSHALIPMKSTQKHSIVRSHQLASLGRNLTCNLTYAHTHTHAHTLTCAHPFAGTTQAVAAPPKVAPRTAPKEWSTQDVSKVALKDVPLKSLYPDEPSPPKPVSTPPLLQSAFLLHDLQGRIIAACKVGYPSGPCKQLGLSSAVLEQGPTLTTLWAREPGPTDGLYPFAFSLQPLFLSLDMHLAHPIALAGRSQDACGHCGQWPGRAVHCSGAA